MTTTTTPPTTHISAAATHSVLIELDLPYGPDDRHRLDVVYAEGLSGAPTILVVHGGGWYSGNKGHAGDLAELFAERGFVAAVPNYRLVGSSGENAFPIPAEDVACAAAWLQESAPEYGGDSSTMLITGFSAGGHLSAVLAFETESDRLAEDCPIQEADLSFDAYIGFSGPYELRMLYPDIKACNMLRDVVGGTGTECFEADPSLFTPANPIDHVTADDPPSLLVTGDMDCKVSFPADPETGLCRASPDAFATALEEAGVSVDLLVLPGVVHDIDYDHPEVVQAIDSFLRRHGFLEIAEP